MGHTGAVEKTISKHVAKTQITRERVLAAAEQLFVEEGFERTDIEVIAKAAGRTKGSIYANFKNKDELFLVLCRQRSQEYFDALKRCLENCNDHETAIKRFKTFLIDVTKDKRWPLLMLEFKLYAIRRPEVKAQWDSANNAMTEGDRGQIRSRLVGRQPSASQQRILDTNFAVIGPFISALIVESAFQPETLSAKRLASLLDRVITFLLEVG
jgi:AcrR family transcriptional regulator